MNDARATGYLSASIRLALGSLSATMEVFGDEMPEAVVRRIREVMIDLEDVVEDVETAAQS